MPQEAMAASAPLAAVLIPPRKGHAHDSSSNPLAQTRRADARAHHSIGAALSPYGARRLARLPHGRRRRIDPARPPPVPPPPPPRYGPPPGGDHPRSSFR